jgi:hypothetical protein
MSWRKKNLLIVNLRMVKKRVCQAVKQPHVTNRMRMFRIQAAEGFFRVSTLNQGTAITTFQIANTPWNSTTGVK